MAFSSSPPEHSADEEGRCNRAEDSADRRGLPEDSLKQPAPQLDDGKANLFLAGTPAGLARPRRPHRRHRRHVAGGVHHLVTVVSDHAAVSTVLRRLTARLTARLTTALASVRLAAWKVRGRA
jgi:hypothetical protein